MEVLGLLFHDGNVLFTKYFLGSWSHVRADQDKLVPAVWRLTKEGPRSLGNARIYRGEGYVLDETQTQTLYYVTEYLPREESNEAKILLPTLSNI